MSCYSDDEDEASFPAHDNDEASDFANIVAVSEEQVPQRVNRYSQSLNVAKHFCSLLEDTDEGFYQMAMKHFEDMLSAANDNIIGRQNIRNNSNATMLSIRPFQVYNMQRKHEKQR